MATLPNTKRLFCPHCKTDVSKTTWYRHFQEFYDNNWRPKTAHSQDFNFESDSNEDEESFAADSSDYRLDLEVDDAGYGEPMETVN